MNRVCVGVDGSPASRHALWWAGDLAGRAGLALTAVRVIQPLANAREEEGLPARRQLEEWCASLPARCADREVAVAEGDAAESLLATATEKHADLLVVGSRGTGEVAGLHLGSVARHLGTSSTAPLAIVDPAAAVTTGRIVVSHEPGASNTATLAFAAELARRLAVPITAVYTFDPYTRQDQDIDGTRWHERAVADVHAWAASIEATGTPVRVYVDQDRDVDPEAAITYALHESPGAVAVVGTHSVADHRAGRRALEVVRHSHHAVILVPEPSEKEHVPGSQARSAVGPTAGDADR